MIPSTLQIATPICMIIGIMLYYSAQTLSEMKSLHSELSALSILREEFQSDTGALKEIDILQNATQLQELVRDITRKALTNITKALNRLREDERILQSISSSGEDDDSDSGGSTGLSQILDVGSPISVERINYADILLGAYIEYAEPISVEAPKFFDWFGDIYGSDNSPENLLSSSMKPGDCYGFKRSNAIVTIGLAKRIYVQAIELQHIPKHRSPTKETSSAPRKFQVFALDDHYMENILGDFEYDNIDTYQVFLTHLNTAVEKIRIYFISNHGNRDFTCVYKVAVYGREGEKMIDKSNTKKTQK